MNFASEAPSAVIFLFFFLFLFLRSGGSKNRNTNKNRTELCGAFGLGFLLLALLTGAAPLRAAEPAREFRGAWVATVFNIDWPSKPGLAASEQQAQLRAIFNRASELKLNAILLQIRPAADALYASRREPWSAVLTGKQGVSPGYDPLEFAIAEAHARGIELHAWFNPFRASTGSGAGAAANHLSKTHPDWLRKFGSQTWLDPGEPDARRYVIDTILDVVRRYQIDGVHIDDYFYPYPLKGGGPSFPDDSTWARFGAASGLSRPDWRRENINRFVEAMYRAVKAEKSQVRVGISPFGIYRPHVPESIDAQLDAYSQLFADSRLWLQQGWCDYLAPQLYWDIAPPAHSFPVLLEWWRSQSRGRPIWPGIASDRIGAQRPASEIANQIAITRRGVPAGGAPGHIHWNMKALMRDQGGIDALLTRDVYRDRAELPRR